MTDAIAIPGYNVVRQLGRGGMAAVYLAIQQSFEREVALKVMSPLLNSDPSFTTRFMREARIVAHIHHASIVPVFDVGEHQPHHYLSMEYLPGGDLKQRIMKGQCDAALAVGVCMAVSSALDLAHRKGFVHRDVKPENILFREDGTPVLTDFGIARAIDTGTSLTVAGMLVGTPSYMSPEQVKGLELDGRSDLYSLGIVMYEMLTGVVPFRADSTLSVALKHLTESLPPLPTRHAAYQALLDGLTAKERDERFATGGEVIQALRHIGDAQVVREQTLIRSRLGMEMDAYASMPTQNLAAWVPKKPRFDRRLVSWMSAAAAAVTSSAARAFQLLKQLRLPKLPQIPRLPQLPRFDRRWLPWAGAAAAVIVLSGVAFLLRGNGQQAGPTSVPVVAAQNPSTTSAMSSTDANANIAAATPSAVEAPAEQIASEPEATAAEPADTQETSENAAFKQRVAELIERNKRLAEQRRQREAKALAQEEEIRDLLAKARSEYEHGFLFEPAGANAADHYRAILKLQPQNSEALAGVQRICEVLVAEATRAEVVGNVESTRQLIGQISSLQPGHPALVGLQAGLTQMEAAPVAPTRRQQAGMGKAASYIAKANEYLSRTPMNLRWADAATDEYDRASTVAPLAPGLPYLKDRIIAAYAAAAQTELDGKEVKRALRVISYARERKWLSPELEQLESRIKAAAQP
jgi:serine/threonine protein kinase